MAENTKISLIGMMGSGKSTIASSLSKQLKIPKIDSDKEITKTQNKSINEIFAENGEEFFRTIESAALKDIFKNNDNFVLATGGGIIKEPNNLKLLLDNSIVIYLSCNPEIIIKRLQNDKSRPLLKNDLQANVMNILEEREDLYKKAHITIDTSSNNIKLVTNEILKRLK